MDEDPSGKARAAGTILALVVGLLVFGGLLAAGLDVVLDGIIAWLVAIALAAGLWIRNARKRSG